MTKSAMIQDTGLRAFHGDPAIKEKYVARVEAHRVADEIIQQVYIQRFGTGKIRGCAIGCTIHSGDHEAYPTEIGVPTWLAFVEDHLFEWMPIDNAKHWPGRFLNAIPVGANLSKIYPQYIHLVMTNPSLGVPPTVDVVETRSKWAVVLSEKLLDLLAQASVTPTEETP